LAQNRTDGSGLVQTQGEDYSMFHRQQMSRLTLQWRPGAGDLAWLSLLVEAFEQTSQSDLGAVPCDESVLHALQAQLARPAAPRCGCGPGFRFLH
jgi:hypothetical protein